VLSAAGLSRGRRRGAPAGSVLSRRGDVLVSQAQRTRMLSSAVAIVCEHGYGEMSVSRITAGAGVSRRTFYDLFEDREDCFLAAFDDTVSRVRGLILAGWQAGPSWSERTRGALLAFLLFLDREPGARELLVVDALKAGVRVQARRAVILRELSNALHESGSRAKSSRRGLPNLTGESTVGAVLGVIHNRLAEKHPGAMVDLLNPLMGVIVLPYLGPGAVQRELVRRAPEVQRPVRLRTERYPADPLAGLPMRMTHRTLLVLAAIAEHPGVSNRQVASQAGITDQGQISKLLARLQNLGVITNTSPGQPSGEPNEWRLTPRGQQIRRATESNRGEEP
jgi:AcrR family transcriptional regulator